MSAESSEVQPPSPSSESAATPAPAPVADSSGSSAEEQLAALTAKFTDWQLKAKAGSDRQRAKILDLQTTLAAKTAREQVLELQLEELSHRVKLILGTTAQISPPGPRAATPDPPSPSVFFFARSQMLRSVTAAAAVDAAVGGRVSAAAQQQQERFDRYKERSAAALRLAEGSDGAASAQVTRSLDRAKQETADARASAAEAQQALCIKDQTISALEAQLDDYAAAGLRKDEALEALRDAAVIAETRAHSASRADLETDPEVADIVQRRVAAAVSDARLEADALVQAHSEELEALRLQLASQGRRALFHDDGGETAHPTDATPSPQVMRRGNAAPAKGSDAYVESLLSDLDAAQAEAQALRAERDQLQATASAQAAKARAHDAAMVRGANALSSSVALSGTHPPDMGKEFGPATELMPLEKQQELHRALSAKSSALWEAQQQIAHLRSGAARPKPPSGPSGPAEVTADGMLNAPVEYQRAVVMKLLTAETDQVRGSLMPVIATVLHLSPEDLRAIFKVNPDWRC